MPGAVPRRLCIFLLSGGGDGLVSEQWQGLGHPCLHCGFTQQNPAWFPLSGLSGSPRSLLIKLVPGLGPAGLQTLGVLLRKHGEWWGLWNP